MEQQGKGEEEKKKESVTIFSFNWSYEEGQTIYLN